MSLDPTIGAEIRKTRPGLVVSNDISNLNSQTVTVLPLTTSVEKAYPFEVLLKAGSYGNEEPSKAKANQIRTVDKRRLGKLLGLLPSDLMARLDAAMRLHLSL